MDYEKKYKEALKRAKGLLEGMDKGDYFASNGDIENIFPELKESEDEKTRKELIAFLEENLSLGYPDETWDSKGLKRWIAWLENQGEHKPFDYENATIKQKDFAPKVEPKFKVGDKVTIKGDNTVYTIGVITPYKTCWLTHGSRTYGWATFGVLKHYVE